MSTTDHAAAVAPLLADLKRPALLELVKELCRDHASKRHKVEARDLLRKTRQTNAELEAMAVTIAAGKRRRTRKVHLLACGWSSCQVEAGHDSPALVLRLVTPTTTDGAAATCADCRELAGLDSIDLEAEAEEEAEVRAAELATEKRTARADAKAEREANGETPAAPSSRGPTARGEANADLGLDDGAGVTISTGSPLAILYPYKGEQVGGLLHTTGIVEVAGTLHRSPSAAALAVTGGQSNGWARWRYVAADGQSYPIDRLRGNAVAPVRVGVTGRRPSKATALARLARAETRAAKFAARLEAARAKVTELEAKHAIVAAELVEAEARALELGAELHQEEADDRRGPCDGVLVSRAGHPCHGQARHHPLHERDRDRPREGHQPGEARASEPLRAERRPSSARRPRPDQDPRCPGPPRARPPGDRRQRRRRLSSQNRRAPGVFLWHPGP